ncbi:MAG: hypothetical protein ACRDTR_01825 [Rubrobacter sp.]
MIAPNTAVWIRVGLMALPLYGLLTLWGTFTHQPDPNTEFEAYARYTSSTIYLVNHLVASIFGTVLAILGAVALGAFLAGSRVGRMSLFAMVSSVAGHALILTIFGFSTFASPAIGRAYLAGREGAAVAVNQDILGIPLFTTALLGGLLYTVGAILFGVAIWRTGTLPKWAGVLYAPTGFLISIVGLMIGQAQTLGTLLLIVGGGWIVWSALRQPTPGVEGKAQPRVH